MASQSLILTGVDDFGLVQRGPDDVAVCAATGAFDRTRLCKLIDNAVVYYKTQGPDAITAVFRDMGNFPPGLPNMPPGRIPEFYRIIAAMRFAQEMGGRALTLKELLFVVEAGGGSERGREDDYYRTRTLVKAVLKIPLTPQEKAFIDTVQGGLAAVGGGGTLAAAAVLGAGGFAVGGPVGAGIGFAIGLLTGKK